MIKLFTIPTVVRLQEMRMEMKLTSRRISDILRDYFAFQCKMAKGLHAVVVDDRERAFGCAKKRGLK